MSLIPICKELGHKHIYLLAGSILNGQHHAYNFEFGHQSRTVGHLFETVFRPKLICADRGDIQLHDGFCFMWIGHGITKISTINQEKLFILTVTIVTIGEFFPAHHLL